MCSPKAFCVCVYQHVSSGRTTSNPLSVILAHTLQVLRDSAGNTLQRTASWQSFGSLASEATEDEVDADTVSRPPRKIRRLASDPSRPGVEVIYTKMSDARSATAWPLGASPTPSLER